MRYQSFGVYANPNDTCDDTLAIESALGRAGQAKTVYFPAGDGIHGELPKAYRVSRGLNVSGRRLMGENHTSAGAATRIEYVGEALVGPPNTLPPPGSDGTLFQQYRKGSVLFATNNAAHLENLIVDAARMADYAIYLYRSGGALTTVRTVTVQNANKVGLFLDESGVFLNSVVARCNLQDGIMLVNANGGTVISSSAHGNDRNGIVVTKRQGSPGAGGVKVLYGVVQYNGIAIDETGECGFEMAGSSAPAEGNGIYVLGTLSTTIVEGIWLEGNRWDGLRAENAHDVHFLYNQTGCTPSGSDAFGDSLSRGIALHDCRHCTVRGNQLSGPQDAKNCEDILVASTSRPQVGQRDPYSIFAYVSENIYNSGLGPTAARSPGDPFEVHLIDSDRGVKSTVSQHHLNTWQADTPPTSGIWTEGDIVWNRKPGVGEPAGWMCERVELGSGPLARGGCTSWLAMGLLSKY